MLQSFTAPENIRFPPQSITNISFVVQWDAVINQSVDKYIVLVYWTDKRNPIQRVTAEETSYTITGLTPNTTYTVTVTSVDVPNCNGLPSASEEVTTKISISIDTNSTVSVFSSTKPTASVNKKVTYFLDTTPTTIVNSKPPSINPTVTTITTDNTVTDVINVTMKSVTKLVPTMNVMITSTTTLMPTMNATNLVVTASKLIVC